MNQIPSNQNKDQMISDKGLSSPETIFHPSFEAFRQSVENQYMQCVHCGLCLSFCPTYREIGTETDSPRGRIYLIRALSEGRIPVTDRLRKHISLCLECRACETACPSGVKYGHLMEEARHLISSNLDHISGSWLGKIIINQILPYPLRLDLALWPLRIYQRLPLIRNIIRRIMPHPWNKLENFLNRIPLRPSHHLIPEVTPPTGDRRWRVGFMCGCIMDANFVSVNLATVRVLVENGCEVVFPRNQRCCGALHLHRGNKDAVRRFARNNIDVFEKADVEVIVLNSAGCGAIAKEYAELLRDDPKYREKAEKFSEKVQDVSEFLMSIGPLNGKSRELKLRVTYDDACHLIHGQKVSLQPRMLIKSIPGIDLVEMKEADSCCGSAGIYNLIEYDMAMRILDRKMANIAAINPDLIITGNPGCLLQLAEGVRRWNLKAQVLHTMELIDWAYK